MVLSSWLMFPINNNLQRWCLICKMLFFSNTVNNINRRWTFLLFKNPLTAFQQQEITKKGFANIAVVFCNKSCIDVSPRQSKCTIWVNQLSFSNLDVNIATQQLSSLACFYKQTYWSILQIIEIAIFWDLTAIVEKSFLSTTGVIKNDCKTFTTQTFTTPDVHHLRRSPPPV